ncbi:hypothetical protein DPMN_112895 [Dreissena polymorpha]|uniref:Uncharacterized protein n=1 Tax=Dreissena polymorpha TaxID=45954 RepID=A0A9D4KHD6_DREPO|nr:hypothetical protein DPMN_112895 [Dreissena polymorpha]
MRLKLGTKCSMARSEGTASVATVQDFAAGSGCAHEVLCVIVYISKAHLQLTQKISEPEEGSDEEPLETVNSQVRLFYAGQIKSCLTEWE